MAEEEPAVGARPVESEAGSGQGPERGEGDGPSGIRAEEIIAAIYAQVRIQRERGREVTGVVLPLEYYRTIQQYRAMLGDTRGDVPDYLARYELFGVPIYTDTGTTIVIKTKS